MQVRSLVRVSEKDFGRTITLRTGDMLNVRLTGNPTTGYNWSVADGSEILKQLGDPEFESAARGLPGAGGKVTIRFRAVKPGKTVLKLAYQRLWEKSVPPIATFQVTVIVKKD